MDSTATFSLFFRGYPRDRAYYVASGIEQAIDFLEDFRFEKSDDQGNTTCIAFVRTVFLSFCLDFGSMATCAPYQKVRSFLPTNHCLR